ncbi:hypothetical protein Pmani_018147 [Petrolisthes manimaculis]|uniref:Ionotropic glutamate receptor L-glutamate and glycine-binding domain-containing protein n=1 Tax=Petrolisthes manimaculis TaxID=1843537 RepID=A0AAE1PN04_9EUCA|nr:hypothetical protein Pmani_018147 [Petrolisthes manimaculis]
MTSLLSGPLSGQDLLLVTDDHTQRLLDLDQVVEAAGASFTPVFLSTQHSLLHTPRPSHHTKGTLLTALLLFHQDPTDFLLLLADNTNWNPSYLVLFCLNPNLNTTTVLSQPVVQRSQFILLLQTVGQVAHKLIIAFTSLPFQHNARGLSLVKSSLGVWSPDKFHSRQSLFPLRFKTFGNQVLEVTALCYSEPFVYYDENNTCSVGMSIDLLHIISKKLQFTFIISIPPDFVYSSKVNGTWGGMFGQLMYEGKHLLINIMQVLLERISDFDYTYPYWADGYAFVLCVPPPLPQWRNILYPFPSLMWVSIFATTVTVSSLLAIFLYYVSNVSHPFSVAYKFAAGLVAQGMGPGDRKEWWVRVWLAFWWIGVQIMSLAYRGILVAVLTIPASLSILHTVQEVAESEFIPIMLGYGDSVSHALRTSENPTLATIGRKLTIDQVFSSPYVHIMDLVVREGTHVALISTDYLRYTLHELGLVRDIYLVDEQIYRNYNSWFLPRNTPYTTTISDHLIRILETGIVPKSYEHHVGAYTTKDKQVRGDGVLNLSHLQGAFILLGLGMGVALLILLLELLANNTTSSLSSLLSCMKTGGF